MKALGPADQWIQKCFQSRDLKEGRAAFTEKRTPEIHREIEGRLSAIFPGLRRLGKKASDPGHDPVDDPVYE